MGRQVHLAGELTDHWTVVTGGSMGIGLGIARSFVRAGANVMIVARRAEALATAADELGELAGPGQQISTRQADTSDRDAITALFEAIDNDLPRLDTFVANAGSGVVTPFVDIPIEEWDRTIAFNLTGTFLACQHAARRMVASNAPNRSIIVVSSIRSMGARPGRLAYSITKAGLNQLVRVAAYELAEHGVRVNGLLPGITATPMALDRNPEVFAEMAATVPLRRAGTPDDMGEAARYLASPAARFVTGTHLVVDGGESLW